MIRAAFLLTVFVVTFPVSLLALLLAYCITPNSATSNITPGRAKHHARVRP